MATVEEILAAMADTEVSGSTDQAFVINPDTRQIDVPGGELVFGVESDTSAEKKWFLCSRYVGNGLDLASCFLRVNYRNANGDMDAFLVEEAQLQGDNILFGWELSRNVTAYKGQVKFLVCACLPGSGSVWPEWHTTLATGLVLEGMEPDSATIEAETKDVVAQLLNLVASQVTAVENAGSEQIAAVEAAAGAAESAAKAKIEEKGAAVLASLPEDYTALSAAVEGLEKNKAPGVVCEASGSTIALTDASDNPLYGLRIFGKSTQEGTPTPEAPVEIVSVGVPTVTITDGTEENVQTLAISTPTSLPGIPVASDGNYTDENGQEWICDEVDLERGVYVQRIQTITLDGTEEWYINNAADTPSEINRYFLDKVLPEALVAGMVHGLFCSIAKWSGTAAGASFHENGSVQAYGFTKRTGWIGFAMNTEDYPDVASFTAKLVALNGSGTPVKLYVANRVDPTETALSDVEIAAYRALHTNKPDTVILNSEGAGMTVEYTADTKLYIDNKIAALVSGS